MYTKKLQKIYLFGNECSTLSYHIFVFVPKSIFFIYQLNCQRKNEATQQYTLHCDSYSIIDVLCGHFVRSYRGIINEIIILDITIIVFAQWKHERLQCWTDQNHCQPIACNVSRPSRHLQLTNISCNLTAPVLIFRVHVQLFRRFNAYQPFMIDMDFDGCEFFARKNVFSMLYMPIVAQYSNLNHSCPISGHIWVEGLMVDSAFIQNFQLLHGQYYFDFRTYNARNESIVYFRSYFKIFTGYAKKELNSTYT